MAQFLSNLAVGTKVKFGKHSVGSEAAQTITWLVADRNHTGYPTDSTVLITEKIIDLRAYDAAESNKTEGNKNYVLSNIHQWLNSDASAGNWYSATHSNDTSPSSSNVAYGTAYADRPGFLYHFTKAEKHELLTTTLPVQIGSDVSGTLDARVFLPSFKEITGEVDIPDGTMMFSIFGNHDKRVATLTAQAFNNTLCTQPPTYVSSKCDYWTRNSYQNYEERAYAVSTSGDSKGRAPNYGHVGVRPVVVLSNLTRVSDIADSEGAYTVQANVEPYAPTNVRVITSPIYTTKPCTFQWDTAIDPEGDAVTYKVHLYYDGVEVANADGSYGISVGTDTSYTLPSVKSGVSTISIGVEAIDVRGYGSALSSVTKTVLTNAIPTISGSNGNLGIVTSGFTHSYTVNDTDSTNVTVKEYIDNVEIRSYVATQGATNNFAITGETWLKLANGLHTLKITANDGIDLATRTITFTKNATVLMVQRATPMLTNSRVQSILVTVVKNIPEGAIFKVEACNNGYDASPTWEDITTRVVQGRIYDFTNIVSTSGKWGVNIRVTVDRNGASGACYITEIGGNFE